MFSFRHIVSIFFLSLFLSGLFFVGEHVFFPTIEDEEIHLEPILPEDFSQIGDPYTLLPGEDIPSIQKDSSVSSKEILDTYLKSAQEKKRQEKIFFSYIPKLFSREIEKYRNHSQDFLRNDSIEGKIQKINIEFYKNILGVRGKMKNKTVKIFGVSELSEGEFLSVFIHEFGHYLDLYFFSQGSFGDTSTKFYELSWKSTKIIKGGQKQVDFVSGYAMTNKYEDFSESFTYYILHNNDFAQKAEKSEVLRDKYAFFGKYLFFNGEFIGTDFSKGNVIRSYYWDITKIEIDTEFFLQKLKNNI